MFNPADTLTELGFTVHPTGPSTFTLTRDGVETLASIVQVDRPPTPAKLRELDTADSILTIFVTHRATKQSLESIASTPGAALIAADGMTFIPGLTQSALPRSLNSERTRGRTRGRTPWGKYALLRALLRTEQPRTQAQLAHETGITQASVSMMLQKLTDHAFRTRDGWVPCDRDSIWETFLASYPGATQLHTYWYSRQTFWQQAKMLRTSTLLSADGAADELAPWRNPSFLVAYAEGHCDLTRMGFSPATATEANIEISFPLDRTIFATARAWGRGVADPAIAAWDLNRVGGPSQDEAIAKLKEFALHGVGNVDDHPNL